MTMKFIEPAAVVADLDRHARQQLLLHRAPYCQSPDRTPQPREQRRILRRVEHRLAEVRVRDGAAEIAAARAQVLRGVVQTGRSPASKLRFASVQVRVAVVDTRDVGRLAMNRPPFCAASR